MTNVQAAPVWSLVGAARVIGGYVWLEERLFETLGGWVPSVAEPEGKLLLDADSHHHAWHASLWRQLLPALRELVAGDLVAPSSPELDAFMAALAASPSTIERLVAVYRVLLPRQVVAYQCHRERASSVTDGPTIRALELVLADDLNEWRQGERLLQQLLRHPRHVERAAVHQATLEGLLVGGGDGGAGREPNPPDGDHPSQPL